MVEEEWVMLFWTSMLPGCLSPSASISLRACISVSTSRPVPLWTNSVCDAFELLSRSPGISRDVRLVKNRAENDCREKKPRMAFDKVLGDDLLNKGCSVGKQAAVIEIPSSIILQYIQVEIRTFGWSEPKGWIRWELRSYGFLEVMKYYLYLQVSASSSSSPRSKE